MSGILLESQEKSGCAKGSWDPAGSSPDVWGRQGGTIDGDLSFVPHAGGLLSIPRPSIWCITLEERGCEAYRNSPQDIVSNSGYTG